MSDYNKKSWSKLHLEKRFRPKYPSEVVVQYVFRNFERDYKAKILDLGCGAGRHIIFLAQESIVPYGIDFSDTGIEFLKEELMARNYKEYVNNVSVGEMTNLPYEEEFFDGIICYGVLYYLKLDDIKKAIEEMYRVLKKEGKILLVVRNTEDYRFKEVEGKCFEKNTIIINEKDKEKCAYNEDGMLMHFFEKDELYELFGEFTKVEINRITESHDDSKYNDDNFIVLCEK